MTRTQTFLLGSALWLGGVGVFAGFAYAMNQPRSVPAPEQVSAPVELTAANIAAEPVYEHIVTIPTIEIVGHPPKALRFPTQVIEAQVMAPATAPPAAPPQMHCGNWRPLEQGGSESSVRECQ
ncbi:MAG: hypothetical protein ACRELY_19595 [Polyangiaceae bacterium]